MKNTLKSIAIALMLMMVVNVGAQAQVKVGHINSAELLNSMAEYKAAEKNLETYGNQLKRELEQKIQNFESEYVNVQKQVADGGLTPKEIADKEQYFQQKQVEIQKFEAEATQKVNKKRESLLEPILQKAESAINKVAADNGYSYVLDTSTGVVLYANEADDITAKVKAAL